jgi:hypothetical protein
MSIRRGRKDFLVVSELLARGEAADIVSSLLESEWTAARPCVQMPCTIKLIGYRSTRHNARVELPTVDASS